MNTNKTSKSNSISQQARLLMVDNRQRKQNRQSSMLERAVEEINIK